ncbi:MAG: DUF4124 domain-containing protein [Thermoguttaceae bacterium]|nr:DUF4124 domain-containing protein [Thermoguttaceae bacterium]
MAIRDKVEGLEFVSATDDEYVFKEVRSLENYDDLSRYISMLPKKGRALTYNPTRFLKSKSVNAIGTGDDGRFYIEITYRCGGAEASERTTDVDGNPVDPDTPPWLYRCENYQSDGATEETTATGIYLPDFDAPVPFVNTAGVPLQAATTRNLRAVSFSYNVRDFSESVALALCGTVNRSPTVIAGVAYPARCVKLENIGATLEEENDAEGYPRWRYHKINVELLVDPLTWNRDYLNVGNHVRLGGGLRRIWQWTDADGSTQYGDLYNANKAGAEDVEETTEPMFLTPEGDNISPFDAEGRQIPTYITGCLSRPADWTILQLPQVR